MNNGNENRPHSGAPRPQNDVRRRRPQQQVRRPVQPPRDVNDALNERYEEMVTPRNRADAVNRGKYADLSTFESRGHRKIDPAVMRARKRRELIRRCIPVAAVAVIAIAALWVYLGVIRPSSQYEKAVELFGREDYSSAEKIFDKIYDYKDSRSFVAYIDAREAFKGGDYSAAKIIYESLGDFYDSRDMAKQAEAKLSDAATYEAALKLLEDGDYAAAKAAFEGLGAYRDSAVKAQAAKNELDYAEATRLLAAGQSAAAKELFLSLGSFRDSAQRAEGINADTPAPPATPAERYAQAVADFEAGRLSSANLVFNELGGYADSKKYADYTYAIMCAAGGDYGTAYVCFKACGDFLEAKDKSYDAGYNYAMSLYRMQDESKLPEIIGIFTELGGYADSADMLYAAKDQYKTVAVFAYNDGDKARALAIFESLAGHPECDEWALRIRNELA